MQGAAILVVLFCLGLIPSNTWDSVQVLHSGMIPDGESCGILRINQIGPMQDEHKPSVLHAAAPKEPPILLLFLLLDCFNLEQSLALVVERTGDT